MDLGIVDRAGTPMSKRAHRLQAWRGGAAGTLIGVAAAIAALTGAAQGAPGASERTRSDEIRTQWREPSGRASEGIGTGDRRGDAVVSEAERRKQELDELSARLDRAAARRAGKLPAQTSQVPTRLGRGEPGEADGGWHGAGDRVAVLLVMKPGSRGIRRLIKSADPVLCVDQSCYVSRGPVSAAAALSRARTFGATNTLGGRAGACSDRLGCVFRNVTLSGRTSVVQPVDLRIISHDRREARAVSADVSCRIERAVLACDGGVMASDYMLWVVPETLAERAGPAALEAAVANGLGTGPIRSAKAR